MYETYRKQIRDITWNIVRTYGPVASSNAIWFFEDEILKDGPVYEAAKHLGLDDAWHIFCQGLSDAGAKMGDPMEWRMEGKRWFNPKIFKRMLSA